jgi:hypothetical protein
MPGPRDYKRSTVFALATLGQGTCYWPKPRCTAPLVVHINREPVTNLEIAHIRAAEPNGPRYVPDMSDNERRAWANLILLCTPHHNMVDKIRPDDYSIEDLERWKSDRETGGLARLKGLNDLTEDRLQEMLAYSIREAYKEVRELLAEQKPMDPDVAMLLSEAASHLNMATAETLYEASSMLTPALNEYAEMLHQAAFKLAPLLEEGTVLDLYNATQALPDLITRLDEQIWELRRLQGNM